MSVAHDECRNRLVEIGELLGFEATRNIRGKMFKLATPDCVWYYKGAGRKELRKIAKGDNYQHIPLVAFEIAYSEGMKGLRGSMMSLQLANASASIIVLLGSSVGHQKEFKKLVGRYSSTRFRIWTNKDVDELYNKVKEKYLKKRPTIKELESYIKAKYKLAVGELSLTELSRQIEDISKARIKVSGRSYKNGRERTISIPIENFLYQ
jgi:hypothetical protein